MAFYCGEARRKRKVAAFAVILFGADARGYCRGGENAQSRARYWSAELVASLRAADLCVVTTLAHAPAI